RHFQLQHPGNPSSSMSKKTTMHQLYGFRGDTVLVETDESLMAVISGSAYDSYRAAADACPRRQQAEYRPPQDPKALDGFLYATKWHEHIANCDIPSLRALVAYPQEGSEFGFLGQAVKQYVQHVLQALGQVPTLVLRLINSPSL